MMLAEMLRAQLELQIKSMKDGNPQQLTGDEMADFMRWNAFALEDEIHEAMQEVGWKPWATHRGIAEEAFLEEMVDAWHFFMNMLLCALPDSPEVIAEKFSKAYMKKREVNAQRQEENYTGTNKCPGCARDMKGAAVANNMAPYEFQGQTFCSKGCAMNQFPSQFTAAGALIE